MRMLRYLALICLLFPGLPNAVSAQTDGSQILTAYRARLVVIGEVVYLGKPLPVMTTAVHTNYQLVVFRVTEVLKGKFDESLLRVIFVFGIDSNRVPESDFQRGNKFILLLEEIETSRPCHEVSNDWKFEPTPESLKYAKAPCYRCWQSAAIPATTVEIKAVKWLLRVTNR